MNSFSQIDSQQIDMRVENLRIDGRTATAQIVAPRHAHQRPAAARSRTARRPCGSRKPTPAGSSPSEWPRTRRLAPRGGHDARRDRHHGVLLATVASAQRLLTRRIRTTSRCNVTELSRIFTELYGPERTGREQPRVARRRRLALGALQQRLRERVLPVRHRADRSDRLAAAARAGLGLHLSVRSGARRVHAVDLELRSRSSPNARTPSARAACRSASPISASRSTRSRAWICSRCRRYSRTTTPSCVAAVRTSSRQSTRSTPRSVVRRRSSPTA